MKRLYTLSGVFLLALFAAVIFPNKKPNLKSTRLSEDQDNPLALGQYLNMRYADPKTGKVPFGATYNAYMQLVAKGLAQGTLRSVQSGGPNNVWQLVNDFFPSIAITNITYDPQHPSIFYFCTGEGWDNADEAIGAGVFKSTDGGNTWAQLPSTNNTAFDYCEDIKVHPTTSAIYLATKSSGLLRSQDGGNTWHEVLGAGAYQASANSMCNIAFTKNGGIFCTGSIFETWGGIYYSDSGDSGTWVKQTNGFPATNVCRVQIATAPSNDSVAYAVAQNATTDEMLGMYKTTDKGQHWDSLKLGVDNFFFAKLQAWYDLSLAVDPKNDSIVVAGGWEIWRTMDGGNSWNELSDGQPDSTAGQYVHVDQHQTIFISPDTLLFGNDGGIWECDNFTSASPIIYSRNYGYRVTQFYTTDMSPTSGSSFACGGTQDNGSPAIPYSGVSNYYDLSWADGAYCAVNYNNPSIVYTTKNSNGTYRCYANNGYATRDTISNPYLNDNNVLFVNPLVMDPNNPEIIYMGSTKGLWRLTNASTAKDSDWTQACFALGHISAIGISKSQPNTIFIGRSTGGAIYYILGGDTTTASYRSINCDPKGLLPSNVFCSSIFVDPQDVNHVFSVYSNYGVKHVWETHNATLGSTVWTSQDGNLPNLPVNDIFLNPGDTSVCYVATDLGVYYTTKLNGDSTQWLPSNSGLANVRCEMFKYRSSDNTIIVATHGRGIYQSILNTSNSGSYALTWSERGPNNVGGRTQALMIDPNVPSHHKVWAGAVSGGLWYINNIDSLQPTLGINTLAATQNYFSAYPNPFNGTIHFTFKSDDNTENKQLIIFDISGKIMQQLNCGAQNQFDWQPQSSAAPGLYFAELISGGNTYLQKIIYLK